jgi:hypothetical protein
MDVGCQEKIITHSHTDGKTGTISDHSADAPTPPAVSPKNGSIAKR